MVILLLIYTQPVPSLRAMDNLFLHRADTGYADNPTLEDQLEQAAQQSIPWVVILKEKVYKER